MGGGATGSSPSVGRFRHLLGKVRHPHQYKQTVVSILVMSSHPVMEGQFQAEWLVGSMGKGDVMEAGKLNKSMEIQRESECPHAHRV